MEEIPPLFPLFNLFVPKTVAKLYRGKACVSTGN
jgi:hypothetical protein